MDMNMNKIFSTALGINDPWFVSNIKFNVENKRLDIDLNFKPGSKFEVAGIGNFGAYDTVQKSWRHLNFFEHECYLNARVPRVKDDNGTLHTVTPGWSGLSNGFTLLFEALILLLAMSMPVAKVSALLRVSSGKIWRMLDNYVNSALLTNDYSDVSVVGMDETSIAKGHDYITLFVDLIKKQTISITRGKDSNTVKYLASDLSAHNGDAFNIEEVSCDMSPAFIHGVTDNLPNAKITFDKFHVLKIINEAVDKVRRAEVVDNPVLRGLRYIFLKNECNLTAAQLKQKQSMATMGLKAWRAMLIREGFQDIYHAKTKQDFELLLKKWYFWATHSKLDPIKKAAKMVKNHWAGIVRWKDSQINNGILEGLNSVLQAAKRKARGYKFNHFRTIAFLITGKLRFNQLNYALPT